MKNIEVPNQAAENLESLEDEDILELTEETTQLSEDDEEILELTDIEDKPSEEIVSNYLSQEQLEAALERVIKKMFADKIDSILVEVIEKSVTKEIERLKDILIEDAKDDLKL